MNYRRNEKKLRALSALCAALAVLVVALGAWAVVGQVRTSKLNARIAALEAGGATTQASAVTNADYDPDAIAAEFEGGVVTVGEAMEEYQLLSSYYEMLGMSEDEYAEDAKTTVLSGLVETKILDLKAKELGLGELTDAEREEVEAQAAADFEENVNYYMAFRMGDDKSEADARAETIAYLAENGTTLESSIEQALLSATQERLYDYVTKDMTVDDEQLRTFYEEQLSNAELTYTADFSAYETDANSGRPVLWHPEGVRRVQSILIPFTEEQSVEYLSLSAAAESGEAGKAEELDALYETLQPEAQKALDRLNGGEDFEALMAEYGSLGPEAGSCVGAESTLNGDAFRDAAMALAKVGDVSEPVRTNGGLCILRYAGDVTPGAVPFEEVAEELRSGYEDELKLSQYNAAVVQWIADANPHYYTDRL